MAFLDRKTSATKPDAVNPYYRYADAPKGARGGPARRFNRHLLTPLGQRILARLTEEYGTPSQVTCNRAGLVVRWLTPCEETGKDALAVSVAICRDWLLDNGCNGVEVDEVVIGRGSTRKDIERAPHAADAEMTEGEQEAVAIAKERLQKRFPFATIETNVYLSSISVDARYPRAEFGFRLS